MNRTTAAIIGCLLTILMGGGMLPGSNTNRIWAEDIQANSKSDTANALTPADEQKIRDLAQLIQRDPKKATAQIDEMLKGPTSEPLREGLLYLVSQMVPEASYPQIVRISYMEGDVRIARAVKNEDGNRTTWEDAVMNLSLSQGDMISTGKDGRAEIEFEDASTIYLDANSVLTMDALYSTSGVPHTELALMSGTTTLHLDSLRPGESYIVRTPTNEILTRFPHRADMRVTSYLNGVALTTLTPGALNVPGSGKEELVAGKTFFYGADHKAVDNAQIAAQDFTAWDAWVSDRHASREESMHEMMKQAGLSEPIPGLAEMRGKGSFYKCEYGTCWKPVLAMRGSSLNGPTAVTPAEPAGSTRPAAPRAAALGMGATGMPMTVGYVPCLSGALFNYYSYQAMSAQMMMTAPGLSSMFNPYDWAICHAGSWIYQNDQYAWVPGQNLHHKPPVHWIRFGHTTALVPIHPRDVKGKPPVNREHGFVATRDKRGYSIRSVAVNGTERVKVLGEPPRGFRNTHAVLTRAEAPKMMAYSLKAQSGTRVGVARPEGVPLRFDARNQTFSTGRQVLHGNRSATVFAPVNMPGGAMRGGFRGGGPAGGFGGATSTRMGAMNGSAGGGFHGGGGGPVGGGGAPVGVSGAAGGGGAPAAASSHK